MLRYTDMLSVDAPLILGVRLKPLSLGHILHLQANDCVFISPYKVRLLASESTNDNLKALHTATVELLLAVTICSMSYYEFNELVQDGKAFERHMKEWSKVVTKLAKQNKVNLLESIGILNSYISNGYQMPAFDDLRDIPMESGSSCNWPHTIIATLCSEMNYTRKEVLEQPLNVTLMDYFKIAERNGLIHLQSDTEQAMMEAATKWAD